MDHLKIIILCAIILSLAVCTVYAAAVKPGLALNPVFGSYMVLQRDVSFEIFGTAVAGKTVTVELAGQKASAMTDAAGEWSVKMQPLKTGAAMELKASSGKEEIILTDVLAGDVWFCSGQSNMEWILANTDDGAEELKNYKTQPDIRLFLQQQKPSQKPQKKPSGEWTECTLDNVKNFSAVAYFFAKNLQKKNNIPVGLIDSAWGGTSIEIWMKEAIMKGNPVTQPILDRWKNNPVFDWKRWHDGAGMDFGITLSDIKFVSKSGKPEIYVNVTPNASAGVGGAWNAYAAPGSSAVYKSNGKDAVLSGIIGFNAWANTDTMLSDGKGFDLTGYDEVRFNVKGTGKFSISLGQESIKDYDYHSSLTMDAEVKPREIIIPIDSFKQGGWGKAVPFTKNSVERFKLNIMSQTVELPSALYNGMVAPFTRYKIKGALWYQGENNAGRAKQYKTLLPMLINSWRKEWGQDFYFYVVQLTSFMERKAEPGQSEWAELREAQLEALKLKNTAVISIMDWGDAVNIHPRFKDPVGARLAQAALVQAYNQEGPAMGPIYSSMKNDGNKIIILFDYIGSGLEAKGCGLKGFAIAGEDKVFKWANAEIKDNTVVVWNDDIKEPKSVRYAWADNPECNLYNKDGLAASPFRTDDWPGLTDNNY